MSTCTLCDTSNHFNLPANSHQCSCDSGYFPNLTVHTCDSCSAAISHCLVCSSSTVCTTCITPLVFTNSKCQCSLSDQYYNSTQVACFSCNSTCLTCSDSISCLTCDSTLNRVLEGSKCVCKVNYHEDANGNCIAVSSTCTTGFTYNGTACHEICGDGVLFDLDCDDGNLESGDGCSAECAIETNFTCQGGSSSTPSKCSYNRPLEISLVATIKDLYANAINFTLKITPVLKVLKSIDFSLLLSSNLPSSSITGTYQSG
mgnify:CR=1 FL=1